MTLLAPWTALTAGLLAFPALLLLYFLKLRRLPRRVPSTLLWTKSIEDLQVNAPFQRLKWSLLLLLQALIVLAIVLALGRPVMDAVGSGSSRHILLIDVSASMSARDADRAGRARLDAARDEALSLVDRLTGGDRPAAIMVIAFARTARVMAPFGATPGEVRDAIRSLAPTDESADLPAALRLADAFAATNAEDEQDLPEATLFSDGGVGEGSRRPSSAGRLPAGPGAPHESRDTSSSPLTVRASAFHFIRVGPESEVDVNNLGITALSARRDPDDPAYVDVLARFVNASRQPVEAPAVVMIDGRVASTMSISLPGAGEAALGETSRTFRINLPMGGLITVQVRRPDSLACDDQASISLAPPRRPRIAVITGETGIDPYLRGVLEALDPEQLIVTAQEEPQAAGGSSAGATFDLLVYDGFAPAGAGADTVPGAGGAESGGISPASFDLALAAMAAPALVLAGGLPGAPFIPAPTTEDGPRPRAERFISWDRTHPFMRHVELDDVIHAPAGSFVIDDANADRVEVLARGPGGPAIIALKAGERRHVATTFRLIDSNWPARVSVLVFLQNLLDAAPRLRHGTEGVSVRPGEAVTVPPLPGASRVRVTGLTTVDLPVEGRARLTLPTFSRVGVLTVEGVEAPFDRLAINVMDAAESDIRPIDALRVNAERIRSASAGEIAPRELWPWFGTIALMLLVIEWLVYARRVRV